VIRLSTTENTALTWGTAVMGTTPRGFAIDSG
jgi:hypothetical protein